MLIYFIISYLLYIYKAIFCGIELREKYPNAAKCYEILFNKI